MQTIGAVVQGPVKMTRHYKIIKNKFGYHEVSNKPTAEELSAYYSKKYYQSAQGSYEKAYSPEEEKFTQTTIKLRYEIIKSLLPKGKTLLDVGCGEGFILDFYDRKGWDVLGLDFSSFAISKFNPHLSAKLILGDIFKNLNQLDSTYDLIILDNVLEHVLDPQKLLLKLAKNLKRNGIMQIEVPNDYSPVQETALKNGFIKKRFWASPPDHLTYFNKEGLVKLFAHCGYKLVDCISDFPIDWDLYNAHSNYAENKSVGKESHLKRVRLQNLFADISLSKCINLYRAMSDMQLGRQICAFFTKK